MRNRDIQIKFWLSEQEYRMLQEGIKKTNLRQSTFLRKLIMEEQIYEALPRDYYRLCTEISQIGNNINQIARKMNQDKPDDAMRILYALFEIRNILLKPYIIPR